MTMLKRSRSGGRRSDTPLTPPRKSLLYFGLTLALFSLFRLALYVVYRNYFGQLSVGQIAAAFAHGVRFDAAVIAVFFLIPMLLLNLPLRFTAGRAWQLPFAAILWAIAVAMGVVLAADVVYFGYVNRHIAAELFAIGQDLGAMFHIAFTSYPGAVAAYAALCAGLAWLWWRIAARETA